MTEADYLNEDNNIHDTYNAYIGYDMNGNITGLDRNGGFEDPMQAPAIDQLRYFYKPNSNQLQKVTDLTNDHQGFKDDGNGTLAGDPDDDYAYDAYGNMTKDQNKGITHIKYNHMNLPVEVDFANNQKITYLYTAMGTKLQKTVDYNTYQVITDYRDGYQYETKPQTNGGRGYAELLFFPTAEGYVKALYKDDPSDHAPAAYQYVYIYKDHLGNNRLSYTLDPETNQIKILEENHYYPFGLKHGNYNAIRKDVEYQELAASKKEVKQVAPEAVKFKYLYNAKELQDELGLDWYDYGARNYQADLGRWFNVDPQTESYVNWTPYNYGADNPILFVDPNGEDIYMFFYVNGYKHKEDGRMFLQAALTKAYDFLQDKDISGDNDIMIINNVQDLSDIGDKVNNIVDKYSNKYGKTRYFGMFSHSGLDGPTGGRETSKYALDKKQMSLEGWNKINFNWTDTNASAAFYGCRSGVNNTRGKDDAFTTKLSGLDNFKNVRVYGQTDYTYPSRYTNVRKPSTLQIRGLFVEPTYMVAGSQRLVSKLYSLTNYMAKLSLNAKKMRVSINGKTSYFTYQYGRMYKE